MMSITLHALDPERGSDREILKHRHRPEVREIFAAEMEPPVRLTLASMRHERGIGDSADHAFAVLVAGAGVSPVERASGARADRLRSRR